jgi:hypothetical protein
LRTPEKELPKRRSITKIPLGFRGLVKEVCIYALSPYLNTPVLLYVYYLHRRPGKDKHRPLMTCVYVTEVVLFFFLTLRIRKYVPDFIDTGGGGEIRTYTTSQHHGAFFMGLYRLGWHHTMEIGLFPFICEKSGDRSGAVLMLFALGEDGLLGLSDSASY